MIFFISLTIFSILFFQKQQLTNKLKIAELQKSKEILQAQSEIQDQTLQKIGNELHDNIGQLLSLAIIYINVLDEISHSTEQREQINSVYKVLKLAIKGVRDLTKSLDANIVKEFGLIESLSFELERLSNTGKYKTNFSTEGDIYILDTHQEIILFRVVQEFLNNTIKHSEADRVELMIKYDPRQFTLLAKDNGIGFNYQDIVNRGLSSSGAGLRNIQNRVELIGGSLQLKTSPGFGTLIEITLPVLKSI
ncbi:hypothetical protein GCM10027185_60670 [Spirosoma pulveris]